MVSTRSHRGRDGCWHQGPQPNNLLVGTAILPPWSAPPSWRPLGLWLIMAKTSAHDAQYAAAAHLVADLNPNPPVIKWRSRAQSSVPRLPPRLPICRRRGRPQRVVGLGVGALQQHLPCALKILHGGDSVVEAPTRSRNFAVVNCGDPMDGKEPSNLRAAMPPPTSSMSSGAVPLLFPSFCLRGV